MTNLVASRVPASSAEPAPPPNKALLIGIPLFVVALVVVATLQGNGIFILGFLGFVVALLVSVSLHEGGHFWTARKFGMKATHFFVGFGPTIWSQRRGETEWGFKAIPIGGVTMAELVATGRTPPLIAPFALTRFREDRAVSERASAGTH